VACRHAGGLVLSFAFAAGSAHKPRHGGIGGVVSAAARYSPPITAVCHLASGNWITFHPHRPICRENHFAPRSQSNLMEGSLSPAAIHYSIKIPFSSDLSNN
jgi:hypothetical protein